MTKHAQIRAMLLASQTIPTQRAVAAALHVSPGYVHAVRQEMYDAGELVRPYHNPKILDPGICLQSLTTLLDTGKTFGTLLIDPPWQYSNQGTRGATGRKKKFHYSTMTLDELKALPVSDLSTPNAHCHLWTTVAFQEASYGLLRTWGFEPKSQAIWCKTQIGLGNTWRLSHEILMLGVKGHARTFKKKDLKSWFTCGRGKHSSKPEQVRQWIEQASPGPFIELFGRHRVPGWVVFGDQITDDLFTEDMHESLLMPG